MDLKINKHQQSDKEIWIAVSGEVDAYTAPMLREELSPFAEGDNRVIVNLKNVTYLDSTGLGVFVSLFKQLKKNKGELKLTDLSERLKRLFDITGLSNIMDISVNPESDIVDISVNSENGGR